MKPEHTQSHPNAFRLLMQYILRRKGMVIAATFWLALATAADVAGPLLAKIFIDDYLTPRHFVMQDILWLIAAYMGTQILATVLRFLQTLRFSDLALNAVRDIRERVFIHVLRLPMAYHDKAITGQLVSRITNDTEAIKDLYVQFLSAVVGNVVFLIGTLVAMAILDVRLMLIAALLIPMVVVIIVLYERFSGKAVAEARQLRSDINAQLSETVQGVRVIQAAAQTERFAGTFNTTNEAQYNVRLRITQIGALFLRPALDFIGIVILACVLYIYGTQALVGTVEVGVLYAFVNYLSRYTEPLIEITQRFNLYQQAMVAGSRLALLLDEQIPDEKSSSNETITQGDIHFDHVQFAYEEGNTIIHDMGFRIPPGTFAGIVGHTGSGKSTLVSLLLHFYRVQKGTIYIDGVALDMIKPEILHNAISLIPQEPFVLSGTVRDNITLGRVVTDDALASAVSAAQMDGLVARLPQGLDTLLGERGTRLSTGERQLLAIARALVTSSRVLLLDEATANIDSETEQAIQLALERLRGTVTIIAIAHRLSTIRQADNILVLKHGRLIEEGDHGVLMEKADGYYRRLVLLQNQQEEIAALET